VYWCSTCGTRPANAHSDTHTHALSNARTDTRSRCLTLFLAILLWHARRVHESQNTQARRALDKFVCWTSPRRKDNIREQKRNRLVTKVKSTMFHAAKKIENRYKETCVTCFRTSCRKPQEAHHIETHTKRRHLSVRHIKEEHHIVIHIRKKGTIVIHTYGKSTTS